MAWKQTSHGATDSKSVPEVKALLQSVDFAVAACDKADHLITRRKKAPTRDGASAGPSKDIYGEDDDASAPEAADTARTTGTHSPPTRDANGTCTPC